MTKKIEGLIDLKNKISKIQEEITFEIQYKDKNLVVNLDVENDWCDSSGVLSDGIMKAIPMYDSIDKYHMACFSGKKGSVVKDHHHSYDEILICTKGSLKYIKEDGYYVIINPLESVFIKKKTIHGIEFIEDAKILVFWDINKK